jgi:hypothetical protein
MEKLSFEEIFSKKEYVLTLKEVQITIKREEKQMVSCDFTTFADNALRSFRSLPHFELESILKPYFKADEISHIMTNVQKWNEITPNKAIQKEAKVLSKKIEPIIPKDLPKEKEIVQQIVQPSPTSAKRYTMDELQNKIKGLNLSEITLDLPKTYYMIQFIDKLITVFEGNKKSNKVKTHKYFSISQFLIFIDMNNLKLDLIRELKI